MVRVKHDGNDSSDTHEHWHHKFQETKAKRLFTVNNLLTVSVIYVYYSTFTASGWLTTNNTLKDDIISNTHRKDFSFYTLGASGWFQGVTRWFLCYNGWLQKVF